MRAVAEALEMLRAEPGDVGLELGAVATDAVELDVQPKDVHVHGHDAREEHGEEDDPEHAAA